MDPLPTHGKKYNSSLDAVNLVCALVEMKGRVEKEIGKRGRVVNIPERINRVAVNVAKIFQRFERKQFFHFESEESYIKEFGEWLIQTHAEVTGTRAGEWIHKGVAFNPAVHLRKPTRIFTG